MKVAAIIAEYNPFHNGHKYQIDKARELLGEDTAIISIMSGNYTQRGEIAIADKAIRSRAAVDSGVNLVLELPFPHSMASAEFFATAGVYIANALGMVDYLVFGSECESAELLSSTAKRLASAEFKEELKRISLEQNHKNDGYPVLCEICYKRLFGEDIGDDFFTPNNILALEYLKALSKLNSAIIPFPITREGAGYSDESVVFGTLQSASAIRNLIAKNDNSAYDYMPNNAKSVFLEAVCNGNMPTDIARLDNAVISYFRLNSHRGADDFHDARGGLYNRLCDISKEVNSISSLTAAAETKKYTKARIRRATLFSYLGVTSSDVRAFPSYTQVLAMDDVGKSLLKEIKRTSTFTVLTKPSSYRSSAPEIIHAKELSDRADSVFALTHDGENSARASLTFTPYVKK